MKKIENLEEDIKILADNLILIRKTAGWSTQKLGDMVGLSKVSISNIENKKYPLTKIQYIALRTIIDYEIKNNKNTKLKMVMDLIYGEDTMNLEQRQKAIAFVSGTANMKMSDETFKSGLRSLIGVTIITGAAVFWLSKVIKK